MKTLLRTIAGIVLLGFLYGLILTRSGPFDALIVLLLTMVIVAVIVWVCAVLVTGHLAAWRDLL